MIVCLSENVSRVFTATKKGLLSSVHLENNLPSLKHPKRYKVGILMTKAKRSSIKVFRALYVIMRQGR